MRVRRAQWALRVQKAIRVRRAQWALRARRVIKEILDSLGLPVRKVRKVTKVKPARWGRKDRPGQREHRDQVCRAAN